jgi:dGTPase
MDWVQLLSAFRLERPDAVVEQGRSPFQQDIDRIVFSSAFRRLAHKTQVHPLSNDDHVHTRLTHSIEVASVGRSLGTIVGAKIAPALKEPSITADTFGYIVQAACLAHDIGNPPFGHSGEDAIGTWFARDEKARELFGPGTRNAWENDFRHFEGNAQGFRILTQLENNPGTGGLQLTYAVLGTFTKYPCSSLIHPIPNDTYVGSKKFGYFASEQKYFEKIANALGLAVRNKELGSWARHPLAFLVEAADDICYAIIDIEDGFNLGYIEYSAARDLLAPIAAGISLASDVDRKNEIAKLRAVAIGTLIQTVAAEFLANESLFLAGTYNSELIAGTKFRDSIAGAKALAKEKIYWSERKTKIEIAGSKIIGGILDFFEEVVIDLSDVSWDPAKLKGRSQKLARLVSRGFDGVKSRQEAWLRVTDLVSGMTDRYALDLYRTLNGITI